MAKHVSQSRGAEQAIRDRIAFRASAMSGEPVDGRHVSAGRMPRNWAAALNAKPLAYVVWSYGTPIAWVTQDGEAVAPDVGYSVTTSRHQGIAMRALDVQRSWACACCGGTFTTRRPRVSRPGVPDICLRCHAAEADEE